MLTKVPPQAGQKLVATVERPLLPAAPGVEQEFSEIVERVYPNALNRAAKVLENLDDAHDAVGTAIEKVWAVWTQLTPEQMSDAYLYRAVKSEIAEVIRERQSRSVVSIEDAERELDELAFEQIERASRHLKPADKLDAVIAAMPSRRREVVLLVHVFHFRYQEVADMLGLSIGTVNTHMRLASAEIRAAFKGQFRLGDGDTPKLASKTGEDSNV
jgi:RNA polymerase sigma factor (sigma-70 family)